MKIKSIIGILSILVVTGCATPDEVTMQAMTPIGLCQSYAMARNVTYSSSWLNASMDELKRRGVLNEEELDLISKKRVRLGMSEHAAVCAWGPYKDVNTSRGSWGIHRQFVMGDFGPYVYTENGKVTSTQN